MPPGEGVICWVSVFILSPHVFQDRLERELNNMIDEENEKQKEVSLLSLLTQTY